MAIKYTRAGFREWLTTLPPDETFCPPNTCPIQDYTGTHSCMMAASLDPELADKIDDLEDEWEQLTPTDVLQIIDRLDKSNGHRD